MACWYPLEAWRSKEINPATGKRGVVFNRRDGLEEFPLTLPCGQCSGCRLMRSRDWALRCLHEASLYDHNCFITLTFRRDAIPSDAGLDVRYFQKFMKRLRKANPGKVIRYFHSGEYGKNNPDNPLHKQMYGISELGRPHYHALLFNHSFPDMRPYKMHNGNMLYTSATLEELWPYGYNTIGELNFETAAYVARYCLKKRTGEDAPDYYSRTDPESGEVTFIHPEYSTMSRRPGIGKRWFDKYGADTLKDFVTVHGMRFKTPRYYDSLRLEKLLDESELDYEFTDLCLDEMDTIKNNRVIQAKNSPDNARDRIRSRQAVKETQIKMLHRNLENIEDD